MSAPRIIAQVVILGSQILGKAFAEAWRQAARNARAAPAAGMNGGAAGTAQDAISRRHNMTLDEAANILNVRKNALAEDSELQKMLKNFDHLFKANNPLTPEGKPHSSHYLQSKIVRAKERIEAELAKSRGGSATAAGESRAAPSNSTTPPPPPKGPTSSS